ncbi:MAG: hypothetical protein ACJ8BW_27280 [Ktedonobacteraceae bacterium]
MTQSEGSARNQKRTGSRKTGDPNPLQLTEAPERETRVTEEDFLPDDDMSAGPLRSSTTSIRRTNVAPAVRTTTPQKSPIPQRRTGAQIQPSPFGTSLPSPKVTQVQTPRNTGGQKAPAPTKPRGKVHWLLPVGIGMIAMLILWEAGTFILSWGMARYDDLRYGNPRTFQTNAVVGHGRDSLAHPSHFIAVNLNRQAIVVEFPAGNPSGAQSYVVPYYILGQGGDLTPVTLEFRDVTGDKKPDMIIHIHLQTQDQTFVFVNDGTKFRPPTQQDNIHL